MSFPPFKIRPAHRSDHDALARLFLETRRATFHWRDPQVFQLADFAPQTEGEAIHVAESADGELLGFISVWLPDRFIHHLFVSPAHQNRGLGRALIASLHAWLPGPWQLKCTDKNTRALAFYESLGWREVGRGVSDDNHEGYSLLEYTPLPPV